MRNILHTDFVILCGPKPGSATSKVKPKNSRSIFLPEDSLNESAKDAKRSAKVTKKDSHWKDFRVVNMKYSQNNTEKSFLEHGKKGE